MQPSELSFVVQGAIDLKISPLTGKPITQSCLESLRAHHPGAEIILSTWPGQPLQGLDYDILVLNEDPGAYNAFRPETRHVLPDNTNRQIVSSRGGLRRATRKYAAKVRSDLIFSGNGWMRHYDRYPERGNEWKIFRERVVTCSMFARDPRDPYASQPLHPPDWIHIGLREDILLLWDIPLQPEPESSQWFSDRWPNVPLPREWDIRRFSPEQYIWRTLLLKHGTVNFEERGQNSPENIRVTELSFANNLIILDPDQFSFITHKYPYPVALPYRYYRFISHREWRCLYRRHCQGRSWAAALERLTNPHWYGKLAYTSAYTPLQLYRKATKSPHLYNIYPLDPHATVAGIHGAPQVAPEMAPTATRLSPR
jgi:hypothetical protein